VDVDTPAAGDGRHIIEEALMDATKHAARSQDIGTKVALLYRRRLKIAQDHFTERMQKAYADNVAGLVKQPASAAGIWTDWYRYAVDATQRSILFWDTMRERGNNFVEHTRKGLPPVLHFDYEMVADGRKLDRPVNYAMVRIVPPAGVTVDAKRRPYLIIDPRAGHGPGIGGFKDDSQVGVALREGHPVYFVIFFPDPEPGQTLLDVCEAEKSFVKKVRELHPASPKPVIVGNCQGGWAAMMLAAADPEDTGPIVINGAPMSYWGGAFQEGPGDNPMRYAGGLLGGTWLASLTSDLGAGIFDGADLVQNFENNNPANTFWDKYYHVYANVDTEPPRFLEFERWWGGFYLMNREEIEWITRNLFVGNKIWTSGTRGPGGTSFDLREIKAPIILFASMGDDITPPQQAFNWVADVYGSTEEIKARGQVIIGLLHKNVGHLGIFVSGKVAKKEHAQIVSVLKSVEMLPPGLYGMEIVEHKNRAGDVEYEVQFHERRLEEVVKRLNRLERQDEKPFEAVAALSEFNQRAYELFAQPFVQALGNEATAKLSRKFHPLRFQRWALSDLNPWLAWLGPAAQVVKTQRQAADAGNLGLKVEKTASETISASLDFYREIRDATSEALFFQTYGNVFSLYLADRHEAAGRAAEIAAEPRDLPFVKDALASIEEGGLPEALARVGSLLARRGAPLPLARLALKQELAAEYRDLLPDLAPDQWRRIRGEQDIIVRFEPEKAIATLPKLLSKAGDRERLIKAVRALLGDERMRRVEPTSEQLAMIENIGESLDVTPARGRARTPVRKAAGKTARKPAAKRRTGR
jgi:pimeloyl-ACP methyl ester carboxylesterase